MLPLLTHASYAHACAGRLFRWSRHCSLRSASLSCSSLQPRTRGFFVPVSRHASPRPPPMSSLQASAHANIDLGNESRRSQESVSAGRGRPAALVPSAGRRVARLVPGRRCRSWSAAPADARTTSTLVSVARCGAPLGAGRRRRDAEGRHGRLHGRRRLDRARRAARSEVVAARDVAVLRRDAGDARTVRRHGREVHRRRDRGRVRRARRPRGRRAPRRPGGVRDGRGSRAGQRELAREYGVRSRRAPASTRAR